MSSTFELVDNRILNAMFTEGLRSWNHSDDVTVVDWPTPVPSPFDEYLNLGQCVAFGPGSEIGQLLGFMPTQYDLWFGIQADESALVDLTVTVKYTDRDMNIREATQNIARIDFVPFIGEFYRIEVPLEDDTNICYFTVTNNASEGEAPVYLGGFYLRVTLETGVHWIDPRFLWLAMYFRQYFEEHGFPEEPRGFWAPPPRSAMSPNEKMLAAQIYDLDRKLARIIKQLGLQQEKPEKPVPKKEKKEKKEKVEELV